MLHTRLYGKEGVRMITPEEFDNIHNNGDVVVVFNDDEPAENAKFLLAVEVHTSDVEYDHVVDTPEWVEYIDIAWACSLHDDIITQINF